MLDPLNTRITLIPKHSIVIAQQDIKQTRCLSSRVGSEGNLHCGFNIIIKRLDNLS
jgi:hypothetical protein